MFNISIEQNVLMSALNYLEPTVGKNVGGYGDNCLFMQTTGLGAIEMHTTNTIEFTKVEAIVLQDGGSTITPCPLVDFKRFKQIISSIPQNQVVKLEEDQSGYLIINFNLKKSPVKMVTTSSQHIPLPTNQFLPSMALTIPKEPIKNATDNMFSIIDATPPSPIYTCMRISTTGQSVEVSGLDMTGKRTFVQTFSATNNNPTSDVLVEVAKLKKSMKIFEDFHELDFNMDNTMMMISGTDPKSVQKTNGMIPNVNYYCRRLTGVFPSNIAANLYPLPDEFVEINCQELKECFSRVKAMEDSNSTGIIGFESDGSSITVTFNTSYGNIEDVIIAEKDSNQTFKTAFTYHQFNDIIKILDDEAFMIGPLPNHPTNFVIKGQTNSNVMFTIPAMSTKASTVTP